MIRLTVPSTHPAMTLMTAVFTPFHPDGSLALDVVERQAEAMLAWDCRAVYVAGTAGEGASLSIAERRALLERWCRVADGRLDVIAHVGHTSLDEAKGLARHAADMGAAAISAVPPYFHRPADIDALLGFLAPICAQAPDLPFIYYHIPGMTGVRLSASEVLRAAIDRLPSFGGIKFADGDLDELRRCLELAGDEHEVYVGNAKIIQTAAELGARTAIGSVYNFAAPLYLRLLGHLERDETDAAHTCQQLARDVVAAVARYGGELPGFKATGALTGVDCGPCRPPLTSPAETEREAMRAELKELGFLDGID